MINALRIDGLKRDDAIARRGELARHRLGVVGARRVTRTRVSQLRLQLARR